MKKIVLFFICFGLLAFLGAQVDFQRSRKAGCPFCQADILEKQLFYRGDGALGILTYKPAVPGHVLIIPERHVERFEELSEKEIAALGAAIKKVDLAVRKTFGNTDYLLLQKNGKGAGQSVPHVHFHYIPAAKFLTPRFFLSPWLKPLSDEELKVMAKKLRDSVDSLENQCN